MRIVVWDSCPGFEGQIQEFKDFDYPNGDEVAELIAVAWVTRYPDDIVMWVPPE